MAPRSGRVSLTMRCTCPGGTTVRIEASHPGGLPLGFDCPACGAARSLHRERLTHHGGLFGCLACGHPELFTTNAFPRRLGILIVLVAAALAPVTTYASLAAAAILDLAIYLAVPEIVNCYVCGAEHHGFPRDPKHPRFDRQIAERLRFGERAVMGRPMRSGGTAGASDPEH